MVTYSTTKYPAQKDTTDFMQVIDSVTRINSALFAKFSGAILAIENELGIKPSGTYSDVRQRLDSIQTGLALLLTYGASHATCICTNFNMNYLSPTVLLADPTIIGTAIGKLPINLRTEAGFPDGYGDIHFITEIYIDSDIDFFEISLWDITATPIEIYSKTYLTPGDHVLNQILATPIIDVDRIFEVRVKQTSSVVSATNINSIIWNSRLLFAATGTFQGIIPTPELKYITTSFDFNDAIAGSKLIGTIETQAMVISTSLIIDNAFDGTTTISVGDVGDTTRLMQNADNIPSLSDTYRKSNDYEYTVATPINLYMTGTSMTGTGIVIVYYH